MLDQIDQGARPNNKFNKIRVSIFAAVGFLIVVSLLTLNGGEKDSSSPIDTDVSQESSSKSLSLLEASSVPEIPALSSEPEDPEIPGEIKGSGTEFQITDSSYLNITLTSNISIEAEIRSIPEIITFSITNPTSGSLNLTLSGLSPNARYFMYNGDYSRKNEFLSNSSGVYFWAQNLNESQFFWIQSKESTKFIKDDNTGGDCQSIGTWDSATKTCTLTQDVNETIQIDAHGITLNGDGYQITGSGTGYGIFSGSKSNIIIKNLIVKGFPIGVYASGTLNPVSPGKNITVTNIDVSENGGIGVQLIYILNNASISGVKAVGRDIGISIGPHTSNVVIENSDVSGSGTGHSIYLTHSFDVVVKNVIGKNRQYGLVAEHGSGNHRIENNDFSNSSVGIYVREINNTITGNKVSDSKNIGIYVRSGSIYNNDYTNSVNGLFVENNTTIENEDFSKYNISDTALRIGYSPVPGYGGKNLIVRNVDVSGPGKVGLNITGTQGAQISNVKAIGKETGILVYPYDMNSIIEDADVSGYGSGTGIYISHAFGPTTIRNITAKNREIGVKPGYWMDKIENSYFSDNAIGIKVETLYGNILPAIITGNTMTNNQYGLYLRRAHRDGIYNIVYHNNIYGNSINNVYSPEPIELSTLIDNKREGNYWGHNNPAEPCFFDYGGPYTPWDPNMAGVTDSACYWKSSGWEITPAIGEPCVETDYACSTISSNGGCIESDDNEIKLCVPEGALDQPTNIKINKADKEDATIFIKGGWVLQQYYRIEPAGLNFNFPVDLTVKYHLDNLKQAPNPNSLSIWHSSDNTLGSWKRLPPELDTINNTVTVPLNGFSYDALTEQDATPPITTASVRCAYEAPPYSDWCKDSAQITLTAEDTPLLNKESGLAKTLYSLDNGNWLTYIEPLTISQQGENNIYFHSLDKADNQEETKTLKIKIDKDTDGDTVYDNFDDCPANFGQVKWAGCPSAIEIQFDRHTVQAKGPAVKEGVANASVYKFDKKDGSCAKNIGLSPKNYERILNECQAERIKATNTDGYVLMGNLPGDYLLISRDPETKVIAGVAASDLEAGQLMKKYLQVIVKTDGTSVPAKTSQKKGSELIIIEPEYIVWNSREETYPFLFLSQEKWQAETTLTPALGYAASVQTLALQTPQNNTLQFTLFDQGGKPAPTKVAMTLIGPSGETEEHQSEIGIRLAQNIAQEKGVAIDANGEVIEKRLSLAWLTILLLLLVFGLLGGLTYLICCKVKKNNI